MTVFTILISFISNGSTFVISLSKTTKSASLLIEIDPLIFSSNAALAPFNV